MKTINKKSLFIIITILVIVLSVTLTLTINNAGPRLSKKEISALRQQYPICGINAPMTVEMRTPSLSEIKNRFETFVYGEVVGEAETYIVQTSTGIDELDDKRDGYGISDEFEFYEYTIRVIDDTEGKKEKGKEITITANSYLIDYNPKLSDGMKIVVPVITNKKKSTRNGYNVVGMYYVTEDGYAISAFDESSEVSRNRNSGLKVEELLKRLKK